jgi:hypothetical protein
VFDLNPNHKNMMLFMELWFNQAKMSLFMNMNFAKLVNTTSVTLGLITDMAMSQNPGTLGTLK